MKRALKQRGVLETAGNDFLKDGYAWIPLMDDDLLKQVCDGFVALLRGNDRCLKGWRCFNRSLLDVGEKEDSKKFHRIASEGVICPPVLPWQYTVFRYRPQSTKDLLLRNGIAVEEFEDFFRLNDLLYERCFEATLSFAGTLDSVLPGYDFCETLLEDVAMKRHAVRLVYYSDMLTEELNEEHKDRLSALSLHVWQSAPGLIMTSTDYSVENRKNRGFIFAGRGISTQTDNLIRAVPHCVRVSTKSPKPRISISFFGSSRYCVAS